MVLLLLNLKYTHRRIFNQYNYIHFMKDPWYWLGCGNFLLLSKAKVTISIAEPFTKRQSLQNV
jgi:hypothetical protein